MPGFGGTEPRSLYAVARRFRLRACALRRDRPKLCGSVNRGYASRCKIYGGRVRQQARFLRKGLDGWGAMCQNGGAVGVPRRCSWKTPPGPRGSNGIQTALVGSGSGGIFDKGEPTISRISCGKRRQRRDSRPEPRRASAMADLRVSMEWIFCSMVPQQMRG